MTDDYCFTIETRDGVAMLCCAGCEQALVDIDGCDLNQINRLIWLDHDCPISDQ